MEKKRPHLTYKVSIVIVIIMVSMIIGAAISRRGTTVRVSVEGSTVVIEYNGKMWEHIME